MLLVKMNYQKLAQYAELNLQKLDLSRHLAKLEAKLQTGWLLTGSFQLNPRTQRLTGITSISMEMKTSHALKPG